MSFFLFKVAYVDLKMVALIQCEINNPLQEYGSPVALVHHYRGTRILPPRGARRSRRPGPRSGPPGT